MKKFLLISSLLLGLLNTSEAKSIDTQLSQDKKSIEMGVKQNIYIPSVAADIYTADYALDRIIQGKSLGNITDLILTFPDVDKFLKAKAQLSPQFKKITVLLLDNAFENQAYQKRSKAYFLEKVQEMNEKNINVLFIALDKNEVSSLDKLYTQEQVSNLLIQKGVLKK